MTEDSLLVLQRCSIGWCRNPISNLSLAEELCLEKVLGVHVMRLAGSRIVFSGGGLVCGGECIGLSSGMDFDVWVPVHACSRDTFEQLVSYWGLVIVLEEATAKPSSFERGWVLVESSVLDRIEERLELLVDGHVFPIRLTESDTLLRGPRVYGSSDSRSSSDEVVSRGAEDLCPQELKEGQFIAAEGR
ncbi:hypothetical protein V6N13_123159 [Hibiscus sabdariffa]